MEQQWHASISADLSRVEATIKDALRSDRPELQRMCDYVITSGGKRIRPSMCILTHRACGGLGDDILKVAAASEIIHCATLVHDDINDKSEIRRGRKAVHKKYTVTKALVLGDFMFAMGFKLASSTDPKLIDATVAASKAMAESEFIQKDLEHDVSVKEEDYISIIKGKTAMPIHTCARAGTHLAGADEKTTEAVSQFALNVGLAFQIVDDVLDVIGDRKNTGKRAGTDIMEGKPTLPIIYAMADPVHGSRIKKIFKNKDPTDKDVEEALKLIRSTDSVDRCMAKAKDIVETAIPLLSVLDDSVYKDSLIGLARFVVSRDR